MPVPPAGAPGPTPNPLPTFSLLRRPQDLNDLKKALTDHHLTIPNDFETNTSMNTVNSDVLEFLGLDTARTRGYHSSYTIKDYLDGKALPDDPTSGVGNYAVTKTPLDELRDKEAAGNTGSTPSPEPEGSDVPFIRPYDQVHFGSVAAPDFAFRVGTTVDDMMSLAQDMFSNAKTPTEQMHAQELFQRAKNIMAMAQEMLSVLSDMQKKAIESIR